MEGILRGKSIKQWPYFGENDALLSRNVEMRNIVLWLLIVMDVLSATTEK